MTLATSSSASCTPCPRSHPARSHRLQRRRYRRSRARHALIASQRAQLRAGVIEAVVHDPSYWFVVDGAELSLERVGTNEQASRQLAPVWKPCRSARTGAARSSRCVNNRTRRLHSAGWRARPMRSVDEPRFLRQRIRHVPARVARWERSRATVASLGRCGPDEKRTMLQ